jgi:hypothetical protein
MLHRDRKLSVSLCVFVRLQENTLHKASGLPPSPSSVFFASHPLSLSVLLILVRAEQLIALHSLFRMLQRLPRLKTLCTVNCGRDCGRVLRACTAGGTRAPSLSFFPNAIHRRRLVVHTREVLRVCAVETCTHTPCSLSPIRVSLLLPSRDDGVAHWNRRGTGWYHWRPPVALTPAHTHGSGAGKLKVSLNFSLGVGTDWEMPRHLLENQCLPRL